MFIKQNWIFKFGKIDHEMYTQIKFDKFTEKLSKNSSLDRPDLLKIFIGFCRKQCTSHVFLFLGFTPKLQYRHCHTLETQTVIVILLKNKHCHTFETQTVIAILLKHRHSHTALETQTLSYSSKNPDIVIQL